MTTTSKSHSMRAQIALTFGLLSLAACSEKDAFGRAISREESQALHKCSEAIGNKLPMLTSAVNSSDVVFSMEGDQIGVAWSNETATGRGAIACFVSRPYGVVTGFNLDGVPVRP